MNTPDPDLAGAGLSATGKTADQFSPGDPSPGTTYGSPGGTGNEDLESPTGSTGQAGATAEGNAEGGQDDPDSGVESLGADAAGEGDDGAPLDQVGGSELGGVTEQ